MAVLVGVLFLFVVFVFVYGFSLVVYVDVMFFECGYVCITFGLEYDLFVVLVVISEYDDLFFK